MEEEIVVELSTRKKTRSCEEKKKLINRLNRIEGQVKGIKKMLENDSYCPEIMMQVKAVNSALDSFNKELLNTHIHTCVVNDIKNDKEEAVDELSNLIQKMLK